MGAVYSGLSTLWTSLFAGEQEIKLLIVGLPHAGKTTVLYRMHLGTVVSTQPTIGANVEEVRRGNVRFVCWDLAGQESLRKTWATYFSNTQVVMLVVDSTERDRISVVKKELQLLMAHEDLQKSILLVLANKQDIKDAMPAYELSAALELHELKGRAWHIEGCCALTGAGLDEGMEWVAQQVTSS